MQIELRHAKHAVGDVVVYLKKKWIVVYLFDDGVYKLTRITLFGRVDSIIA